MIGAVSPRPNDEQPLSKRQRERLRRQTHKERMRRMDEAIARRTQDRSGSPVRVVGSLMLLLAVLAGISAVFVQVGQKGAGGSIEAASANAEHPDTAADPGSAKTSGSSTDEKGGAITVAVVGDMTLGSGDGLPRDNARDMFAGVSSILRGADLTIGSLQGTLSVGGDGQCPGAAAAVCNPYQAPPDNAAALQGAGFDVMDVATQHAYDYGQAGLNQTLAALDRYGIHSAGIRDRIATFDAGGTRVAVVGFAPYAWSNPPQLLGKVAGLVGEAASQADVVIVLGGGAPVSHAFSHVAMRAGADLVIGSGPDSIYSIERYSGRLIAYSMGNFAGYHSFSLDGDRSVSAILEIHLSPSGVVRGGRLHSIVLTGPGFPAPDPKNRAVKLVNGLSRSGAAAAFPMSASGTFSG